MNVFGAFTFGTLIKTFIPGLIWAAAMALGWHYLHAHRPQIFPALPVPDSSTSLVLAIPAAILLGLLSNIVVFMGVNDRLVRRPVRAGNAGLFTLYDGLCAEMRQAVWGRMECQAGLKDGFLDNADAELLIINTVGVAELAFVREQYWYHLEFQMNMLLAVLGLLAALLILPGNTGLQFILDVAGLGGLCLFLGRAARRNYTRHVGKMATLMGIALAEIRQESGQPAGSARLVTQSATP